VTISDETKAAWGHVSFYVTQNIVQLCLYTTGQTDYITSNAGGDDSFGTVTLIIFLPVNKMTLTSVD